LNVQRADVAQPNRSQQWIEVVVDEVSIKLRGTRFLLGDDVGQKVFLREVGNRHRTFWCDRAEIHRAKMLVGQGLYVPHAAVFAGDSDQSSCHLFSDGLTRDLQRKWSLII
jgi:hypothetical protein